MLANTFITFTCTKIVFDQRGKKIIKGRPEAWNKITRDNMDKYNKDNHKIKCVLTGKKNGITVIDCDTHEAYEDVVATYETLKEAYTVKSPRGFHIYVAYEEYAKTSTNAELNIDVRNDGGFIIAPPSVCSDDSQYSVHIEGPLDIKCPDGLFETLYGENWNQPPAPPLTAQERIKNLTNIEDKELKLHLENIAVKDLQNYNTCRS